MTIAAFQKTKSRFHLSFEIFAVETADSDSGVILLRFIKETINITSYG